MSTQSNLDSLLENQSIKDLVNHTIEKIKDTISPDRTPGAELHNELFNQDYFVIGYAAAEEWLQDNTGIFAAIEAIKDYEQDNFGQVSTDLSSSEKVCNMIVYILGEEILQQSNTLSENWDNNLTQDNLNDIVSDLEAYIETL